MANLSETCCGNNQTHGISVLLGFLCLYVLILAFGKRDSRTFGSFSKNNTSNFFFLCQTVATMQVNHLGVSLQLIPESEKDRRTLKKLINSNDLDGWGCDGLGKVLHAEVPLVPIGTIHHARPIDGLPPSGENYARMSFFSKWNKPSC